MYIKWATVSATHLFFFLKKKGYTLNQKGLFQKLDSGETKRVSGLKTEKAYFTKLSMEYLSPENR